LKISRDKRKTPSLGRNVTRRVRRRQLIDATIECLAKRGFADTTMAHVAEAAGLSQGIINFHFRSKEALLLETLASMDEEYRANWELAVTRAEPAPEKRLEALLRSEFEPAICSRKKIAVWHAFYGEAKARPTYQKICGARDEDRRQAMQKILEELIAKCDGTRSHSAAITDALTALTDGIWLDLHLSTKRIDREAAWRPVEVLLARLFPHYFASNERRAADHQAS
jgi:TetR/AcrR family transcriptional repressor of bet genes